MDCYYCVVALDSLRVMYCGHVLDSAAKALVSGTVHGSGADRESAKQAALRQAQRLRGWLPCLRCQKLFPQAGKFNRLCLACAESTAKIADRQVVVEGEEPAYEEREA